MDGIQEALQTVDRLEQGLVPHHYHELITALLDMFATVSETEWASGRPENNLLLRG